VALTSGYRYDLFISYAHLDERTPQPGRKGWVSDFHDHLEVGLSKVLGHMCAADIWRDPRLDGATLFDREIRERIEQAAVFLALTSPSYFNSDYCRQELACFTRAAAASKHGLVVGNRSRLVNIRLFNLPPAEWPAELAGRTGFPFFEAESDEDLGLPISAGESAFRRQLKRLTDSLRELLEDLGAGAAARDEPAGDARGPADYDVYIADVADSLRRDAKRVTSELERAKVKVHPRVPPPHEAREHAAAATAAMRRSRLSVHLLDDLRGRELPEREDATYPLEQLQLGQCEAPAQLIWIPKQLDVDAIADADLRGLLQKLEAGLREAGRYEFVRGTPQEIPGQVLARLAALRNQAAARVAGQAVLLDTHVKDELFALQAGQYLVQNGVRTFINPEEDDPRQNIDILTTRLQQTTSLIVFFGQVGFDWVRARLAEALKIIVTKDCPVRHCAVYLVPPDRDKEDLRLQFPLLQVDAIDNRRAFDPQILAPLVARIREGTA